VPVVEYVHGICGDRIVVSYITEVLLVACGYRSARLSRIGVFACIAFKLVDSAGVVIVRLLFQLLVNRVGGMEGYLQVSAFEKIGDFSYCRAIICEGDPFVIMLCL